MKIKRRILSYFTIIFLLVLNSLSLLSLKDFSDLLSLNGLIILIIDSVLISLLIKILYYPFIIVTEGNTISVYGWTKITKFSRNEVIEIINPSYPWESLILQTNQRKVKLSPLDISETDALELIKFIS